MRVREQSEHKENEAACRQKKEMNSLSETGK